jgi:diamine N-acetyltransferase
MIHIRHATLDDANLLAEIGKETFSDSFAANNTPENLAFYLASAFNPDIQAGELIDPASMFFIAESGMESDGETIGYAQLKEGSIGPNVSGVYAIEIARIYARKPWIGQGVGAALLQACLEEAARRGCDTIWLGVWERNSRAIVFYQKWGFNRVGTHIFQMGDDPQTDWVMERPVKVKP